MHTHHSYDLIPNSALAMKKKMRYSYFFLAVMYCTTTNYHFFSMTTYCATCAQYSYTYIHYLTVFITSNSHLIKVLNFYNMWNLLIVCFQLIVMEVMLHKHSVANRLKFYVALSVNNHCPLNHHLTFCAHYFLISSHKKCMEV